MAVGDETGEEFDPLLGAGTRSIEVRAELDGRYGGLSGRAGLAALGIVVVIGGLLWSLGRVGPDPGGGTVGSSGASSEDAGDRDARPSSGFSLDAGPSPTTERRRATVAPPTSVDLGAGPVLDRPTGLTLFYGGRAPLQGVDLDSGRRTGYGIRAHPMLVTGRTLVLHQEDADLVGWVPLDDPGQQIMVWKSGLVAPGNGPRLLWILDAGTDEPHPAGVAAGSGRWELLDVEENRVVTRIPGERWEEVAEPADRGEPVGGTLGVLRSDPLLSNRPDGVYRYDDSGYRRLASGRMLASWADRVLLGPCPPDGPCELGWIDGTSGDAIDLPVPGIRPRVAVVVGGGRWLHSVGWDGTSELLELDTGRRVEHVWAVDRPTVSPDGRWLAEWLGTTVVISDLGGEGPPRTVGWIEGLEREGPGSLLLAPSP